MSSRFLVLAFIAGAALPIQAAINAVLARGAGHPLTATVISFGIGLLGLLVAMMAFRIHLPGTATFSALPLWAWTGGLLGAVYVCLTIISVPKLGTATLVALVVAGQMAAALALDHFGAFGLAEHSVNAWRILGAILLTAGVVLIRVY